MLSLSTDYSIVSIDKDDQAETIFINIRYNKDFYLESGKYRRLYDLAPERVWQHLGWFQYQCFISCRLPRYLNKENKVKTVQPTFANSMKGYTLLFASHIIETLKKIKVQQTTADLYKTSPYIVRSIMEEAVENGLTKRGIVSDLVNVSLDEKAFLNGHNYATILIDSDKGHVVEMTEGRKGENVKTLFFSVTDQEKHPQIKRVNIDMWEPYINTMKEIAPNATQVHDKFHLVGKLSDAIDKTRRQEVKTEPLLKLNKYTVLKNKENRTPKQQTSFELINQANLKTAQAWKIRENFKDIFSFTNLSEIKTTYENWIKDALESGIKYVKNVVETFERHHEGVMNAFITKTTSGKHENTNGRIQAVLAKARGFRNFERFRINILFHFSNLNLFPLKI
ncbi:MAG: ISL3 family transposase [Bacteroidota bacterium]